MSAVCTHKRHIAIQILGKHTPVSYTTSDAADEIYSVLISVVAVYLI